MKTIFLFFLLFVATPPMASAGMNTLDLKDKVRRIQALDLKGEKDSAEWVCDELLQLNLPVESQSQARVCYYINLYKASYLQERFEIARAVHYYTKALSCFGLAKLDSLELLYIYPALGNNYTRLGDHAKSIWIHKKMFFLALHNANWDLAFQASNNLMVAFDDLQDQHAAIFWVKWCEKNIDKASKRNLGFLYSSLCHWYSQSKQWDKALYYQNLSENQYAKGQIILPRVIGNKAMLIYNLQGKNKGMDYLNKQIDSIQRCRRFMDRPQLKLCLQLSRWHLSSGNLTEAEWLLLHIIKTYIPSYKLNSDCSALLIAENTLLEAFGLQFEIAQKYSDYSKMLTAYHNASGVKDLLLLQRQNLEAKLIDIPMLEKMKGHLMARCYALILDGDSAKINDFLALMHDGDAELLKQRGQSQKRTSLKEDPLNAKERKKWMEALLQLRNSKAEYDKTNSDFSPILYRIEDSIQMVLHHLNLLSYQSKKGVLPSNWTWQEVIAGAYLKEATLYVSYCAIGEVFYSLSFSRATKPSIMAFDVSEVLPLIEKFRSQFSIQNRYSWDQELALRLGQMLLPFTPSKFKEIVAYCHAQPGLIPLEALQFKSKQKVDFWIKASGFQYVPSLEWYFNQYKNGVDNHLKQRVNYCFEPMQEQGNQTFVDSESQLISGLTYSSKWLGEYASRENFIKSAQNPSNILHISAHGAYDSIQEESYIKLYHSTVFSSELMALELDNILTILSACETGLGNIWKGEGALSMAYSFLYAGSRVVLASLWKINQQSSYLILKDFYANLTQNYGVVKALQRAKLAYLSKASPDKSHPYYWAGFFLYGGNSNLIIQRNSDSFLWLIPFLGMIVLLVALVVYHKSSINPK